jgi:TatA/E family protein of Tat protein translocase
MFGIGPPELLVILLIALVVVGPQRLPEVGKAVGKAMREFRKAQDELKGAINFDFDDDPVTPQRPAPHRPRPSTLATPPDEPSEQPSGSEPDDETFDRLGLEDPDDDVSGLENVDVDTPMGRIDDASQSGLGGPSDPAPAEPTPDPEAGPAPDPASDPGPAPDPA